VVSRPTPPPAVLERHRRRPQRARAT
jgi:hypothetical protein